jgi:glycosyltransferase involved in cell wall biosynthesis
MTNRILNIVNTLDTGATENWLVRACEVGAAQHPDWKWTFYCTYGQQGRLDERAWRFGADVIYSPYPVGNKRAFFNSLRTFLNTHPQDVLHCHHDFMSAAYLWAAWGIPFRKRIVHVHNTDEEIPTPSRWKQFMLREPMRQTCLRLADHVIGVSHHTLNKFLRNSVPKTERDRVLFCGIETKKFRESLLDPVQFRRELGFSDDAKVVIFAGRMVAIKNPLFVLEMMKTLMEYDPSVVACFLGTGELESKVEEQAKEMCLSDRVRLLGWRDDVAQVMKVSNLFIFPRLEEPKEALGLVLVEAQAAGLPMLLSHGASEEAIVIPELAQFIRLADGPGQWARRAVEILAKPIPNREVSLKMVEGSRFSIAKSSSALMALYQD